jgi:glycosyltransferase involved in cell wall biosynthesis
MKFLIHSNGPNVSTGYGVQCRYLATRLKAAGHDVAVAANYGQQGSMGRWRDIPIYPTGYEVNGNDVIHAHAQHFFADEPGWIIPLMDLWALTNPRLAEFNVAGWCPVDHYPVPPGVLQFFHRTDAVPVAMSRYGETLLRDAGLDPVYIPLAVDCDEMKPTPMLDVPNPITGRDFTTAREYLDLHADAFVVGMVAMNKGWARDRKGFNEAFRAFAIFWRRHPNAVLLMHSEQWGGAEGINLVELAIRCGIPEHAIRWVDQYAYRLGLPPQLMSATYTAMDVLLSPSHGEGFCVPLIEAQACGTPVIATNFSAQTELAAPEYGAAGWLVEGQPEWDPAQHASYLVPYIEDVLAKLEDVYAADLVGMQETARAFALRYNADKIFVEHWLPFIDTLQPPAPVVREPIPDDQGSIAVLVPAMRSENIDRLVKSFDATNDGTARLHIVHDLGFEAVSDGPVRYVIGSCTGRPHSTFAEKVNLGVGETTEPWLCVVGDDVEFHPGWIGAARASSPRGDLIGTNDTTGPVKNPDVAAGRHADHWLIRRSYIEDEGACLDGPGVLASTAYKHWYCDKEIVELAKARGVYVHARDCVIEHHHPGYDGDEAARQADPVYMLAVEHQAADEKTWRSRLPLIAMQRTSRAKS